MNISRFTLILASLLLIPMSIQAQIAFQDDFTGTTIDTGKWNVNAGGGTITQNDAITLTGNSAWDDTFVTTIPAVNRTSGSLVLQMTLEFTGFNMLMGFYSDGAFENFNDDTQYGFHYNGNLYAMQGAEFSTAANGLPTPFSLRITMGAVDGAKWEYNTGGGWTELRDTRGDATGDAATSYQFYMMNNASGMTIDNILMEYVTPPSPYVPVLPFTENWDTGTIDVGKWTEAEYGGSDDIQVVDQLGNGDYALKLASSNWVIGIHSADRWNRGNNLRCTFRVWHDATNSQIGIHGPFHYNNNAGAGFYNHMEGGLDYAVNRIQIGESIGALNTFQTGPTLAGFTTALAAAGNDKSGSMLVRVTLGDTQGMLIEYDPNGSGWIPAQFTDDSAALVDADSRSWATYPNYNPSTHYGYTTNTSYTTASQATDIYLGFGAFNAQAGRTYIDDIVVEDDLNLLVQDWVLY